MIGKAEAKLFLSCEKHFGVFFAPLGLLQSQVEQFEISAVGIRLEVKTQRLQEPPTRFVLLALVTELAGEAIRKLHQATALNL